MEDIEVILERHEQRIRMLERELGAVKEVQSEIRSMNESSCPVDEMNLLVL